MSDGSSSTTLLPPLAMNAEISILPPHLLFTSSLPLPLIFLTLMLGCLFLTSFPLPSWISLGSVPTHPTGLFSYWVFWFHVSFHVSSSFKTLNLNRNMVQSCLHQHQYWLASLSQTGPQPAEQICLVSMATHVSVVSLSGRTWIGSRIWWFLEDFNIWSEHLLFKGDFHPVFLLFIWLSFFPSVLPLITRLPSLPLPSPPLPFTSAPLLSSSRVSGWLWLWLPASCFLSSCWCCLVLLTQTVIGFWGFGIVSFQLFPLSEPQDYPGERDRLSVMAGAMCGVIYWCVWEREREKESWTWSLNITGWRSVVGHILNWISIIWLDHTELNVMDIDFSVVKRASEIDSIPEPST